MTTKFFAHPIFFLIFSFPLLLQVLSWDEKKGDWRKIWGQPRDLCDVYAYCGAFGTCNQRATPSCQCLHGFKPDSVMSKGCVRKVALQCSNDSEITGRKDQFFPISKVRLPANAIVLSQVRSVGDCESACFTHCSCSAYTYDGNDGCSIWHEELLNVLQLKDDDADGRDFYLKLAASEFPSEGKTRAVPNISPPQGKIQGSGLLHTFTIKQDKQ